MKLYDYILIFELIMNNLTIIFHNIIINMTTIYNMT